MRDHESAMGWIGPLTIIGIFIWYLFGNSRPHEVMCGGSTSCFKDYLLGMSGWVAAGVAGITLNALWKQLRIVQMQARDGLEIQLHRSLILARSYARMCDEWSDNTAIYKNMMAGPHGLFGTWPIMKPSLEDFFESDLIARFEGEIAVPETRQIVGLRRVYRALAVEMITAEAELRHGDTAQKVFMLDRLTKKLLEDVHQYCREGKNAALQYEAEVTYRVRKYEN